MSLYHLNQLLIPEHNLQLPHLKDLAVQKQKNVTILDIETCTNLLDVKGGIVEIAMLHINPHGHLAWTSGLINPERPLSPHLSQRMGLSDDLLSRVSNWKEGWCEAISHIAKKHILIGFGLVDFALPIIQSQHERYGEKLPVFEDIIDIRSLYCFHKNKRPKLYDLKQHYGVSLAEKTRVQADVAAIAVISEKMAGEYGPALWEDKHRTWSTSVLAPSGFTSPEDAVGYQSNYNGIGNNQVQKARTIVVNALNNSKTVREFIANIENIVNIKVPIKFGQFTGYSILIDGVKIKASEIGEEYTLSNLIKTKKLSVNLKDDILYFNQINASSDDLRI